ncbi:PREDICTED: uncharacterized protein LOC105553200 [Mandrillus leucophaeus]|uniref:uncharacterized protein LOC105553200 n=1 Tax=Mandrillus leucophaeus TaxID=9568 RepID=UPI0005F36929|nr:PREDICTED: uncharacterized protein LOC105553200 [Mandrillus leucophaeus]
MGLPSPPRPLLIAALLPFSRTCEATSPSIQEVVTQTGLFQPRLPFLPLLPAHLCGDFTTAERLCPGTAREPKAKHGNVKLTTDASSEETHQFVRPGVQGTHRPSGSGGGGGFPFLPEPSPGAARGPALKRAGNLVYRPRRGADRAFVWKVSISGSGCNVFLVTLASGRPAEGGGSPGSLLLSEADRAGDFCAFVLIFGNLSFFLPRSLPGMS